MPYSAIRGKKVLLLGFGSSGRAAGAYLQQFAPHIYVVDDADPLLPADYQLVSAAKACNSMSEFSLVVLSPGVPHWHACYKAAVSCQQNIVGEAELAAHFFADKQCIGITGTNGKTTVALFLEHVLQSVGIAALAIGNIGIPLSGVAAGNLSLPLPAKAYTHFIIELSSFQLETLRSKILDIALLLNITPDHLDRHTTMQSYRAAKLNIFTCLKDSGIGIVEEQTWQHLSLPLLKQTLYTYGYSLHNFIYSNGEHIFFNGQQEEALPFSKPIKSHEVENFLACYAAAKCLGLSSQSITRAFFSFKKPPHRIEFVAEIAGVKFIDDSKGTNIDAVQRAVQSLNGPIILIAGGVDKGASYMPWVEQFNQKVRCICAIGQAAPKIAKELSSAIETHCFADLESAVAFAKYVAVKGDTVLLSPGCASFDLFADYAHRGRQFKKIVNNLRESS